MEKVRGAYTYAFYARLSRLRVDRRVKQKGRITRKSYRISRDRPAGYFFDELFLETELARYLLHSPAARRTYGNPADAFYRQWQNGTASIKSLASPVNPFFEPSLPGGCTLSSVHSRSPSPRRQ